MRKYTLTSVKNWSEYEQTGNNDLLNDIKEPEDAKTPDTMILAWEGGALPIKIDNDFDWKLIFN